MTVGAEQDTRVLLVTEDPFFIEEARGVLELAGARVVSCLGPAHTACNLYARGSCPLAQRSDIALVDSSAEGEFRYHSTAIPSGEYAEGLQRNHPGAHVLLCGAAIGSAGPTGEVATTEDRQQALLVLTRLLRSRREGSEPVPN
ncbi:MAG TPA: hypothetical protein VE174_13420 [Actinomycetota bacterium]|nr:hypothetical protein [Actinomycetota bacterium]